VNQLITECHSAACSKTYVSIKQWSTHGGSTICLFLNIHINSYNIQLEGNQCCHVCSIPTKSIQKPWTNLSNVHGFKCWSWCWYPLIIWHSQNYQVHPISWKKYRKLSFAIAILDYQSVNMYELRNEVWNEAAITVSWTKLVSPLLRTLSWKSMPLWLEPLQNRLVPWKNTLN